MDDNLELDKYDIIIGVDEAGRGPLFGPVFTSAVILPDISTDSFDLSILKDSKKFSSKKKIYDVYSYIKDNAWYYSVDSLDHTVIDDINIRNATLKSMQTSVINVIKKYIKDNPCENINHIMCIIDGNAFKPIQFFHNNQVFTVNFKTIVKGDATHKPIMAASILAKVSRDNYMLELCSKNPELQERYFLHKNMGYGTKQHIEGIKKYGLCEGHRITFKLKK